MRKELKPISMTPLLVGVILTLCSCNIKHEHEFDSPICKGAAKCTKCGLEVEKMEHTVEIGTCGHCGEMQNADLVTQLNNELSSVTEIGNELIAHLSDIDSLSSEKQYAIFQKADEYVKKMNVSYNSIINACKDVQSLDGFIYQIKLLQNSSPNKIVKNSIVEIADQKTSYRLYLQQISSSFHILSDYLSYLAGNREMPPEIMYYNEVNEMPTPDSCIYGIQYISEKKDGKTIQYTYSIGTDEDSANLNYNIYLLAVGMDQELKVNKTDMVVTVKRSGIMVSAMAAGNDPKIGYFLTVSFQI